jgi:iron complex outermembrane receptor protein
MGLKTSFLDHKVRANVAAFYYDYKNIQSVIIVPNPQIPGFVEFEVSNAGAAKSYGLELEVAARPVPEFQLDLSASALHATYESLATEDATRPQLGVLNLKGNRIPQSPDYVADLGAQYTWALSPGSLTLRGDYKRVGNTYFTIFNCCGLNQPAYGWGDAFLTFDRRDTHWSGTAFVRNISNVVTVGGLFSQATFSGSETAGSYGPPRTYGLTVGYKW